MVNLGASRYNRVLPALNPATVSLDKRSMADLLSYVKKVAGLVQFHDGNFTSSSWENLFDKNELFLLIDILEFDVSISHNRVNHYMQQFYPGDEFKQAGKIDHRIQILKSILKEITVVLDTVKNWQETVVKTTTIGTFNPLTNDLQKIAKWFKIINQIKKTTLEGKMNLDKQTLDKSFDNLKFSFEKVYNELIHLQKVANEELIHSLNEKRDHDPMFALLIAFLKLYQGQQKHLNQWPSRHLNYYLFDILKAKKKLAVPDRTFVQFVLKESASSYLLKKGTQLLADQNEEGLESCYETTDDVYVNKTEITDLKTIYAHKNQLGMVDGVYYAPIANSKDGLGARFEKESPNWPIFGENQGPLANDKRTMIDANIGFVVAGPILVLKDGKRKIELKLVINKREGAEILKQNEETSFSIKGFNEPLEYPEAVHSFQNIVDYLNIHITLADGWHPVQRFQAIFITSSGNKPDEVKIRFTLPNSFPPIVLNQEVDKLDFYGLPLDWPGVKISLNPRSENYIYSLLEGLELNKINIVAEVTQLDELVIVNADGVYNNNQPFSLFGADHAQQPNCLIGNREVFLKNLTELSVNLEWEELPVHRNFSEHYLGYTNLSNESIEVNNDSFKVKISALSATKFQEHPQEKLLFEQEEQEKLANSTRFQWKGAELNGFKIHPNIVVSEVLETYDYQTVTGFFKIALTQPHFGFGQKYYSNVFSNVVTHNAYAKAAKTWWKIKQQKELPLPHPTYNPKVKRVHIDYMAKSQIDFEGERKVKHATDKVIQIYQVQPTGYLPIFEKGKVVENKLIRPFKGSGCLMIGLRQIDFEKPLNIFFSLIHIDNHLLEYPNKYDWYYLSSNQFIPLKKEYLFYDTTHALAKSGIISLYIPPDINRENTLLPNHSYWLMVAAKDEQTSGQAFDIKLNAIETKWIDNGDTTHYNSPTALPEITELHPKQEAISEVHQLGSFFGGWPEETNALLGMRISERLRHKGRAITLWDFERLVLSKFPDIRQAKCVPVHSTFDFVGEEITDSSERGGIRVVVVSDKMSATNLQPFLSIDERLKIKYFLAKRAQAHINLRVVNPTYEPLKLKMKILLDAKLMNQRGAYLQKFYQDITHFICPWINGGVIRIGEGIGQRALVDFLVSLPYVRYVTNLSVIHVYKELKNSKGKVLQEFEYKLWDSAKAEGRLSNNIMPSCPWGILVPSKIHDIEFIEEAIFEAAEPANVANMILETDFIIGEELELFDEDTYLIEDEGAEQISFYW